MKNRGLYGTSDGSERCPTATADFNRLQDNELLEGQQVATLHRMMQEKNWTEIEKYSKKLLDDGFNQSRINSLINRASFGVKL